LLISPTEPEPIKQLGQVSSVPEEYGADILWPSPSGMVGVQRKEFKDLVNSVHDGRLGKELSQMKQLSIATLIIEGNPRWTTTGQSLAVKSWSRTQHQGLLFSVQSQNCWLLQASSTTETIELVLQLKRWTEKSDHSHLLTRPNPVSKWGRADNRDWGIHLLQSFPNIGYKLAGQIYDYFGGVPLHWSVDESELMEVPGVGPTRAQNLIKVLDDESAGDKP